LSASTVQETNVLVKPPSQATLLPDADSSATGSTTLWQRVRRDALLLAAGNMGVVIAQLGFRGILIAALAPPAYGRLSLLLSIYNTVWIVGASGLPNSVARAIATATPTEDLAIIRSAIRAAALPTIAATAFVSISSGLLLSSPLALLFAAVGLPSLIFSLLAMGILRGRGRIGSAASIMPIAAVGEVVPLAAFWLLGVTITPMSAFGVFCLGNALGLAAGIFFVVSTRPAHMPKTHDSTNASRSVPSPRQLLGFSMWLGLATIGVAVLSLVIRSAAALNSYTLVAIIDVALVLLAIPQRIGVVLVHAVVPHAARALGEGDRNLTISLREHIWVVVPFVLAAAAVAFTPIVGWLFGLLGRPEYSQSSKYLAMALLAGPARLLYGLVEGVLIAHGEGRFLAITAVAMTIVASGLIFATVALNRIVVAFAVFVIAFWMIYIVGLRRVQQLTLISPASRET
jgi:O-antigen/teichoic acid export membrane protein